MEASLIIGNLRINNSLIIINFFTTMVCLLYVGLSAWWCPTNSSFANLWVPDSHSLWGHSQAIIEYGVQSRLGRRAFVPYLIGAIGGVILPQLIFIINIFLRLLTMYFVFNIFIDQNKFAAIISTIVVGLFPYTIVGIAGPTKEVPLFLLTFCFLFFKISFKNLIIHLAIIFLLLYTRDGMGLILLGWLIINLLSPKKLISSIRTLSLVVPFIILASFSQFGLLTPLAVQETLKSADAEWKMDRIERGTQGNEILEFGSRESGRSLNNPVKAVYMYVFRIFGNAFSRVIRPAFITENNRISVINVAYFLCGILSFIAFSSILLIGIFKKKVVRNYSEKVKFLTSTCYFLWIGISFSIFIHPRYLYPVIPLGMGLWGCLNRYYRNFILGTLSLTMILGTLVLYLLDVPFSMPGELNFKPEFLFFPQGIYDE